jgi:hypothetical protein
MIRQLLRSHTTICLVLLGSCSAAAFADDLLVQNDAELRAVVNNLQPGTTVRIAPGTYSGGLHVRGVARLTIAGQDPDHPPRIEGGNVGWMFSRCDHLTLQDLHLRGQRENGLNLDDGGDRGRPVTGIRIRNVRIEDVGPRGNHDGLKGSGLHALTIEGCRLSGWGGQGIDLVGCHEVRITGCEFVGKPGFDATAGIQLKGGTADVLVEQCHFVKAGQRPLNVGGSTGRPYFRPPDADYEARRIVVRDNTIEGGQCAAAFASVDGAEFAGNTILFPEKWVFRILQDNAEEGIVRCGNVTVRDNRIVFRRSQVRDEINIGPHTHPETFGFSGNVWFAEDRPAESRPSLPVAETAGTYGVDPRSDRTRPTGPDE